AGCRGQADQDGQGRAGRGERGAAGDGGRAGAVPPPSGTDPDRHRIPDSRAAPTSDAASAPPVRPGRDHPAGNEHSARHPYRDPEGGPWRAPQAETPRCLNACEKISGTYYIDRKSVEEGRRGDRSVTRHI